LFYFTPFSLENEFIKRIVIVRERMEEKSKEVKGKWMTKERMEELYSQ
jgi:hypothetical protein